MIDVNTAVTLFLFGGGFALVSVLFGCVVHMRWLDRKLYKPYPKKPKVMQ